MWNLILFALEISWKHHSLKIRMILRYISVYVLINDPLKNVPFFFSESLDILWEVGLIALCNAPSKFGMILNILDFYEIILLPSEIIRLFEIHYLKYICFGALQYIFLVPRMHFHLKNICLFMYCVLGESLWTIFQISNFMLFLVQSLKFLEFSIITFFLSKIFNWFFFVATIFFHFCIKIFLSFL